MLRKLAAAMLVLIVAAIFVCPTVGFGQTAEEETIAPGDILSVTVLGEPDLTKRVIVDSHGKITIPLANEVQVGGSTTSQAADKLRDQLTKYLKNPQVTIEIAEAAKRQVVVSGAVKVPGVYDITSNTTIVAAITLAGGYNPDADLSQITVTRGAKRDVVLNVDLTKFFAGANPEANIMLQAGDTIVVPESSTVGGSVFVLGEVTQKGPQPIRQGLTFREAIASAGGLTDQADTSKITIKHRADSAGTPVEYVKAISGDPAMDIAMQPGDTIFVPALETQGMFTILGPVARPGQYPIRGTMYITDAIAAAGGATDRGNLNKISLTRSAASGGKAETLKLDVPKIAEGKSENVAMQPGDTVMVSERKAPVDKIRVAGFLLSLIYLLKP
jgi:polysaccharide biosynthesis/export protein